MNTTCELDGRHGAMTYRHARERLGDGRLRAAVEAGRLIGFGRGVLLDAERVLDLRTRCAAALLWTGGVAVVVGPTAAALHGCTAVGGFPIHVRVPYAHRFRSRPGVVVHQGDVAERDIVLMDGLRVLPLDLAVAEVLCAAPRRAAVACADQALRDMQASERRGFVAQVAERLAERTDRRGTKRAVGLLALASGAPETALQSAFVVVLADCGLTGAVYQHEVRDRTGRLRARLDFAWPECRVALECDETGDGLAPNDHLRAQGWIVLRGDEHDLSGPSDLVTRLRSAIARRREAA
jgi:hypothetical protein